MRLLHLYPFAAPFRSCLRTAALLAAAVCLVFAPFQSVSAQEKQDEVKPAPVVPDIKFRERPPYPADSQRLRRTVQIDGVQSDNEWEPFYTVSDGPIHGTFFCQWDDSYLYLAARSETPASLIFDIDCGGDGWLRSADNLELVVGGLQEGAQPTMNLRLLDAANSKDTPVWKDLPTDFRPLLIASKSMNGGQFVEIAIPKNTGSLVLRPGATIGLRGEFLPPVPAAAYTPTAPFEPHLLLDATLVEARSQSVPGINPRLTLSDAKCVGGQNLFATLELLNQTDAIVPIKAVLWTGPGSSYNALNTVREVVVPSLPAGKTLKLKYKTALPADLSVGSYTLSVTAEMAGGRQVQSSVTFAVVEPLQVQMSCVPDPVAIVGPTKCSVLVDVFSAVPNGTKCELELSKLPAGWILEGKPKRGLEIDREDARNIARFNFKLPATTPAGDYPLDATVTWRGRVWKTHTVAHVLRGDTPRVPEKKP